MSDQTEVQISASAKSHASTSSDTGGPEGEAKDVVAVADDKFSSRWAFWASAVAGAVGFGNIWRFPWQIYEYGGAVFFIPYFTTMIMVAGPVMIFEYGTGQLSVCGSMGATNAVHTRARGAGWAFAACANVLHFYPLLMAWTAIYLGNSFSSELPWVVTTDDAAKCAEYHGDRDGCLTEPLCEYKTEDEQCIAPIITKALAFFHSGCNVNPDPTGTISKYSWQIMISNSVGFVLVYFCIIWGAKVIGYVNYVLLVLPTVLMVVLVGVGASMEGSGEGIKQYIGKLEFSVLGTAVWQEALAQVLFSLGAAQGGMMAYGSHNKVTQNFYADVWVIAAGDTLFAFLAGFVVFAVAGFLAQDAGVPLEELPLAGTGLIFQTYPVGLSHFGTPWAQILCFAFFLTVWLLGFASLIAQFETVTVPLIQIGYVRMRAWGRKHIAGGIAVIAFIISHLYCLDMSNHLLDLFDYINANVLTLYLCAAFAFVGGWLSSADRQMHVCGRAAWLTHAVTWVGGGFLASLLGFHLPPAAGKIVGPVVGAILMGGGALTSLYLSRREDEEGNRRTLGSRIYELTLGGVEDLRRGFNDAACQDTCCKIPLVWSILLKYSATFFTPLLLALSTRGLFRLPEGDDDYLWWIYLVGSSAPFLVLFLSVAGFVWPQYMDFMLPLETERVKFSFLHHGDQIDGKSSESDTEQSLPSHAVADEESSSA